MAVMDLLRTTLGRLRIIGFMEGLSFVLLLGVAMPLKYLADLPQAVRGVGMAHGILFIVYIWAALLAMQEYRWNWRRTLVVMVASLLPLGPFYLDARLLRKLNPQSGG